MLSNLLRVVLWPFWPGTSYSSGAGKLCWWSLAFTAFFLFAGEYTFPGGAHQFTYYARALAGEDLTAGVTDKTLFIRDAGYPLLLLATGYPLFYSFIPITLLQAVMAWAMPLLVYGSIGPSFRRSGFYAGLACVISLSPYLFMKWIHHDLPYIFFSLLTIYLLVRHLTSDRASYLWAAVAALIALTLTRPAGNAIAIPLFALLFVLNPARWRLCGAAFLVVALAGVLYGTHRLLFFGTTTRGEVPSYFGQQVFYNPYVNSADFGVRIEPSLGPATSEIFARIRSELKKHPLNSPEFLGWYKAHNFPDEAKAFWFTRFAGHDDAFVEALIAHPSHDYFEFMCHVQRENDPLFRAATEEVFRRFPLYPVKYSFRNLIIFFWSPGYAHGRFGVKHDTFQPEGLFFLPLSGDLALQQIQAHVPPPGRDELLNANARLTAPFGRDAIVKFWKDSYHPVNRFMLILALLALIGVVLDRGELRARTAVAWLFLVYNALVTCVFVEPNYRYHFFIIPIQILCAGFGLQLIGRFTAKRVCEASHSLAALAISPSRLAQPAIAGERRIRYPSTIACMVMTGVAVMVTWSIIMWGLAHPS